MRVTYHLGPYSLAARARSRIHHRTCTSVSGSQSRQIAHLRLHDRIVRPTTLLQSRSLYQSEKSTYLSLLLSNHDWSLQMNMNNNE